MLSNQTCTNQAGHHHRRQQSTPTSSARDRLILPRTPQHNERHRRGLSIDDTFANRAPPRERHAETQNGDTNHPQQDGQSQMQETQQTGACTSQISYLPQNQANIQIHSLHCISSQPKEQDCLSVEDIDALISGLGPTANQLHDRTKENVPNDALDLSFPYGSSQQEGNPSPEMETADLKQQNVYHSIQEPQEAPNCSAVTLPELGGPSWDQSQSLASETNLDQSTLTTQPTSFAYRHTSPCTSFPRTAESSPVRKDPNLTLNASHAMHRGRSYQDDSQAMRQHLRSPNSLSPPKPSPLKRRSVDIAVMPSPQFLNMSELKADMPNETASYNPAIYSPMSNALSTMTSFQSSPEIDSVSLFDSAEVDSIVFNAQQSFLQASQSMVDFSRQSSPTQNSLHQRAQSTTDIDLDECVEETGVTVEEIASFIQGPFPEDSKWKCLFEEAPGKICGKRFARKENAKSHVQTHLGDRQFVCKVCNTRFVRQHDLKRHFKIHTTEKPHKCPCGKDFHRHDALTRHRQRGMCCGAFEGTPKKSVKRGRPKKSRPNVEERMEKAAKTRQYVMERTRPGSTYASSISGSSENSHGSPPSFDNVSITASSPSLSHKAFNELPLINHSFEPLTPPTSPAYSTGNAYSSPYSRHSYTPKAASQSPSPKITCIPEESHEHPANAPAPLHDSYHGSPPELDLASSSPATSNFFDFSGNSGVVGSGDTRDDGVEFVNPQFLNGDFPLFDANKELQGSANFSGFSDLNDIDTSQPKENANYPSNDPMNTQESFVIDFVNESDDLFGGL